MEPTLLARSRVPARAAHLKRYVSKRISAKDDPTMAERFEYRFEWDPIKAARNAKEHGVTFEQAATVWPGRAIAVPGRRRA